MSHSGAMSGQGADWHNGDAAPVWTLKWAKWDGEN